MTFLRHAHSFVTVVIVRRYLPFLNLVRNMSDKCPVCVVILVQWQPGTRLFLRFQLTWSARYAVKCKAHWTAVKFDSNSSTAISEHVHRNFKIWRGYSWRHRKYESQNMRHIAQQRNVSYISGKRFSIMWKIYWHRKSNISVHVIRNLSLWIWDTFLGDGRCLTFQEYSFWSLC